MKRLNHVVGFSPKSLKKDFLRFARPLRQLYNVLAHRVIAQCLFRTMWETPPNELPIPLHF